MVKILAGSVAAAIAMLVIGFLAWATPLGRIAYAGAADPQAVAVQASLAQNLTATGTGTYLIPSPDGSAANTILFARGPIATIHFNTSGYPVASGTAMLGGFILDFVIALLIGAALMGIAERVTDFPSRARLVTIFAVAASGMIHIGEPIYLHYDLAWSLYNFVVDAVLLAVAGLVLARWFLPRRA